MPEAHPSTVVHMQRQEQLAAGEGTISKSAPHRTTQGAAAGDRASRASRVSVRAVEASVPMTTGDASVGGGLGQALLRCTQCLDTTRIWLLPEWRDAAFSVSERVRPHVE